MALSTQDLVASELDRANLRVEPEQTDQLVQYLELLHRWGRRVNLTGNPEPSTVAQRLLPDTMVLAANFPKGADSIVDVGAGSGVVGLVLPLLRPGLQVLMVEPNGRRCSFLRTVVHQLQLPQVTVLEGRLEDTRLLSRDVACSRATWSPQVWLERAAPLIPEHGTVVTFVVREADLPRADRLTVVKQVAYALSDGTPRLLAFYRPT